MPVVVNPTETATTTPAIATTTLPAPATTTVPAKPKPVIAPAESRKQNPESTTKPTIPISSTPLSLSTTTPSTLPIPTEQISPSPTDSTSSPQEATAVKAEPIKIDEEKLKEAVVRIRCGSTFGSGYVLDFNGKKYAFTAAHVVINKIEAGIYNCDVIFPRKDENGNYKETYYLTGKILLPEIVVKNYKENGIDLAVLEIIPLENKTEEATIFPNGYPLINYPFCPSDTRGNQIILLGYSANLGTAITPGAFQSRFVGLVIQYADVTGVIKKPSKEFSSGFVYLPDFTDAIDESIQHHLTVILSDNNFSGASGGLVFDLYKGCIIGTNIATLVKDNKVFGFITNPNFGTIKDFINLAVRPN